MKNSLLEPPKVSEIVEFKQTHTKETFVSKSGGELTVDFALPFELVRNLFEYNSEELYKVPVDIRGLRRYRVQKMPNGQVGGTEFHRIRQEIVFGLSGQIRWECEDLFGKKRVFTLTEGNGIYMPPFLLHTHYLEKNESSLSVLCSTLYPLPANPLTNDTFPLEEFRILQQTFIK